ncbi:Uncharacterised protein [Staphylococcus pseudintermedius]|nr:Uncharacterised protein [Staphylococcus pseudintermedius]
MWMLGVIGTIASTIIIAILRTFFWYLKEVITMLFGYSFWACFWFGKCKR